jgi:hypothetical protein
MKIQLTTFENGQHLETREITGREYNNITSAETLRFFRRRGGSETVQRSYTSRGYKVTKLTSINPGRTTKVERFFKFDEL